MVHTSLAAVHFELVCNTDQRAILGVRGYACVRVRAKGGKLGLPGESRTKEENAVGAHREGTSNLHSRTCHRSWQITLAQGDRAYVKRPTQACLDLRLTV